MGNKLIKQADRDKELYKALTGTTEIPDGKTNRELVGKVLDDWLDTVEIEDFVVYYSDDTGERIK